MTSVKKKGGANDVYRTNRQRELRHVVSNAFLPGKYDGRGVGLYIRAPHKNLINDICLCHFARELRRKFPGSFCPGRQKQKDLNNGTKGEKNERL